MGERRGSQSGRGERRNVAGVVTAVGFLLVAAVAVGFGLGPALAGGQEYPTQSGHQAYSSETPLATSDAVTVASDPDYLVEVEPTNGAAGETVEVPIRAKTLVDDDDARVTGYDVGVEFDPDKLLYKSADSPVAADELEVHLDPNDPGRVDLVFDSSVWDNILDEIIGGISGEDPFPTMNTTLARVEFHVVGAVNDTATINLVDGESRLYHGWTDWFGEYDEDNVVWTGGEVTIVEEIEEDGPTLGIPEYEVEAGNTGGYVAISEDPDDPANAEAEGVPFPSCDDGECIELDAVTYDTGYWVSTSVEFPTLVDDAGVEVDVVAPDGLWGIVDRENGTMTARGEFRAMVDGDPDNDFFFEVNATTGESGALSGTSENLDEPSAFVEVVDNEFVVADSTGTAVDPGLGIPNENPGENYIVLPLALTFEEADEDAIPGEVEIQVRAESGDPLENAHVDLADGPTGLTDEEGTVVFETNPGQYVATVEKSGYESSTVEFDVVPEEKTEASVELSRADAYFSVVAFGDSVRAGETATPAVAVENEGGPGQQDVTIAIEGVGISTTESVSLDTGERETISLEWQTEPGDEGSYTVTAESADETAEATVDVDEPLGDGDAEIVALFSATSTTGGWISFDEAAGEDEARAEGLEIPPANASDDREIQIVGEIYDDGTWRSTGIDFPDLYAEGIAAEVTVPGGMAGLIDPQEGSMTGEGTLEVVLPEGDPFSFNVRMVTSESGALSGDVDFSENPLQATLVDNEYVIDDQTGEGFIDDSLGLPATTVGAQWLELVLEIEIEEDVDLARGTVTGAVTSETGDRLEGATVDVRDEVADATTDEDGTYDLELDEGSYTLVVDEPGFEAKTVSVDVVEGETTERDIVLTSGDSFFDVSISGDYVTEGEVAEVAIGVENTGDSPDGQSLTVTFADESTSKPVELDVGEAFTKQFQWPTEVGDAGEYTATIESNDDSDEATIVVEAAREPSDGIDARFTAKSTGGYVATDEETREEALEEGIEFPAKGEDDEYIVIAGEIDGDGWYATSVYFPPIETDAGVDAHVEAPVGMEGTVDRESGHFTATGPLEVTLDGHTFGFSLDLTSGESGSLTGSISDGGLRLVDNEFIVDEQTGSTVLDSALGLPATTPGTNWLELELAMEFEDVDDPGATPETGTVAGTVESDDGTPLADATVDVRGGIGRTTTANDGGYELELAPGTYALEVGADGFESETVSVTVEADDTVVRDVVLEPGTPAFDLGLRATALDEETVAIEATVANVGSGRAQELVTLSLGDRSESHEIELDPGDASTVEVEWTVEAELDSLEAVLTVADERETATISMPDDEDESDAEDVDVGDGATVFTAIGQGGFISIAEPTLEAALEEGLEFPSAAENDTYIAMSGIIHDDGTWEAADVSFPTLPVADGLEAAVVAPDGLTGHVDRETGEMTAAGRLVVEVIDARTGEPADAEPVSFAFELTTGDSGALSGGTDLADDSGSVTLVSNEYVIDDTTDNSFIDGDLQLPALDPGENWLELHFDVEIRDNASATEIPDSQALGGTDDGESGGTDGDEHAGFLAAFGQLIGLLAVTAGGIIVTRGLTNRLLSAVDPDPGK